MKYIYTLIKEDGTSKKIGEYSRTLPFKSSQKRTGMYELLDCTTIELIPRDYYPAADKVNLDVTYFGDEEARFEKDVKRNRHMSVLVDDHANIWDVVGDLIREEKVSERTK